MKIAVKEGQKTTYMTLDEIKFQGITLKELQQNYNTLAKHINELTTTLENGTFVEKDKKYIVEIDGELKQVESLQVFDNVELEKDLKYYKVENGKIIIDKRKVANVLWNI